MATEAHSGMLRLRTVGRKTGTERHAILGYVLDGPNLALMAMNGWADPPPSWWLNLQAHPNATVDLATGSREVVARLPTEDEKSRLWAKMGGGPSGSVDRYAALRSRETPIVILEPRAEASVHLTDPGSDLLSAAD